MSPKNFGRLTKIDKLYIKCFCFGNFWDGWVLQVFVFGDGMVLRVMNLVSSQFSWIPLPQPPQLSVAARCRACSWNIQGAPFEMVCTSKKCRVPTKKRGGYYIPLLSLTKGYPNCWWNATQMLVVAWRFRVRRCWMDPWCCRCDELRFCSIFWAENEKTWGGFGLLAVFW